MKTSWWRLIAFYTNPRRVARVYRRRRRLEYFAVMRKLARATHYYSKREDTLGIVGTFNSFVVVSVEYQNYGGFDQGRVTTRLMEETKPA